MSDVNANIGVHIDTSAALAELKNLQRQIATFHSQISKSSATAAMAQKNLQTNLLNAINATGKFHAQMGVVRTSTESFTDSLEKNKLSMREYFRYAGGASKSFGRLFRQEFDTIGKVAEDRVKKMQTQYIKMGRDASGAMRAMSVTPNTLNMKDYGTQTALAAQKQALFNQLVKQGSTNLLNFGKNTQWAGRQLMVGFTVPLMYLGTVASKTFMDLEQQALKFKRVYGDMFTTSDQTNKALKDVELLAKEFTKYGVAVSKTMEMAASAAAMGKTGADLTAQVAQATRLAVLGNVEQEQALETTISLTSAFGIAAEDLAKKIDFLNSVENQTIVSIEDLTIAVPKAGPVVKQLGGDVEDLAFFLTAMKEGGINASEGANALKSGLASLINPSKKAAAMLNDYGVNIKAIVEGNQGDIKNTVIQFAQALDTLAPLDRSRAIEQLFGKFQFARLSTLFQNITKEGTQANKVLELSKMEVEELAILSERELKTIENAVGTNFKAAVESLKLTIAPIGKTFLEAVTPIVKALAGLLENFNNLGDGTKKFIVVASTLVGIIGPTLLMTFGLLANGAANIVKLFLAMRTGFLKLGGNTKILGESTQYLNSEQLEAATVAASLNQAHTRLTQTFALEASAVKALRNAYLDATLAATNFARANPGMMMPGAKGKAPKKFARGTTYVPGTGNKDTVASMLTPGEAVIPAPIAQDPQFQPIIDAMVSGKLQGFNGGTKKVTQSGSGYEANLSSTKVTFDGQEFNAKSAKTAASVQTLLSNFELQPNGEYKYKNPKTGTYEQNFDKNGISTGDRLFPLKTKGNKKGILDYLQKYSQRGSLDIGQIEKGMHVGSGGYDPKVSRNAPSSIKTLNKKVKELKIFEPEIQAVADRLKKEGIVVTKSKLDSLQNIQASHLTKDLDVNGVKIWDPKNLSSEPGAVNNYMNRVEGKLGQELLNMSDDKLKINRAELESLVGGNHPKSMESAKTLQQIAQYDLKKNPADIDALAVDETIKHRLENKFYKKGAFKTLAERFPDNKIIQKEILKAEQARTGLPVAGAEILSPKEIKGIKKKLSARSLEEMKKVDADVRSSSMAKVKPTDFGKLVSPTSGRSFPVAGIGGVYEKDGKKTFVKPMLDERSARAELNANRIARNVHGLDTPRQVMKVMTDPNNKQRKIIVLESAFDPKLSESGIKKGFTKDQYFKQLVAANLRVDKDLKMGNLGADVLTDPGAAGVFKSASGRRDFVKNLPSMEEMARINLSGVKGDAAARSPYWFGNATADIAKKMTAQQYHDRMNFEIDRVLPRLEKTLSNMDLSPEEKPYYQAMVDRLKAGRKVNWKKLHKLHTSILIKPDELIEDEKTGKTTKPKTTSKPSNVKPSSGSLDDKRMADIPKKGKRFVNVAKRGPRGIILPSEADAPLSQQDQIRQRAAQEGVSLSTARRRLVSEGQLIEGIKKQSEALEKSTVAANENTKASKLSKESLRSFGAKANIGVGAVSGLTIAASFAGGKIGEMAQKIMPFVFGLQGILMLLPMLMNPLIGLPLAIGAVVAGIWLFNKKQNDAIKAEARLVDEVFATTKKMQQVGEISGKVGASQLAARKRESAGGDFSFERKGIKFGSAFLQSEVGKADIAAFEARFKAMPDIAMREFSLKLASYVSDGVIDAAQAASIADQVGIEFQDKVLGIKIQGQLQGLLTSDGKDITQEPFEIRVKIAEETVSQFDNLVPNLQDQLDRAEKQKNELKTKFSLALADEASGRITPEESRAIEQEFRDAEKRVASIKNSIKQNSAFASGMASQAYEAIQAQIDGIDITTSKTLDKLKADKAATKDLEKQALIQKQIDAIELKRTASLSKLRAMNDRVTRGIEQQLKLSSSGEKQAFFTGSAEAVRSRFKGTKQEGDANLLLAKTAQMGQSVVRAKIEAVVSSGQFGPGQASGFINLFANDQAALNKTLNTFLNVQGIDDLNKLQSILGTFEDQELAKDIMVNMSGLSDSEFQAQYSTLELLMQMDNEEINVELVLKDPGALAKITSINTAIENIPNVTKKEVEAVLTTAGFPEGGLAEISANWEYFEGLPSNLRKTALQTFTTLHATIFANKESKMEWARNYAETMTPNLRKQNREEAVTRVLTTIIDVKTGEFTDKGNKAIAADVLAQTKDIIGIQAMIDKMLNPKGGGGGGTGTRNTFLDNILDKIRRVRDASANIVSDNPLGELRRLIEKGNGEITIFDGLDQQISKLKAPQEFIDFIASLDPKGKKGAIDALATYLDAGKLKDGIVDLTKNGKLLLDIFREGVIGDFESDLRKATNGLIAQKTQFIFLNTIVKDNVKSAEMLADANFALSLSSAKTTTEVKRLVDAFNAQKAAQEDLAMTQNPLEVLQDKFSEVEDRVNKFFSLANEAIEARFARRILAGERAVDAAQKQVEKAQKEIETIQDAIDGIQSGIDKKQREIEMSITRPIEAFQETISGIENTINTQFDKPIAILQEESSDLANDLTLLDKAADAINKKYDAQEEALNKIAEINKDLIGQEKQRISLADTLTSGDISAAAQAVQDMRQARAEAASVSNMDMLKAARESELDKQRTAAGLTRLQIEERQFAISQSIFQLEEGREVLEQRIANIKELSILPLEIERERLVKEIRKDEDLIYNITNGLANPLGLNLKLANEKLAADIAILDTKKAELLAIEEERQKELDHLDNLKLQWIEVKGGIAEAELQTISLQTQIQEAIRLSKLLAAEFAKIAVPGGGVPPPAFVANPNASPAANQEAADAAKAATDAEAEASAAVDEATAAANAAADAIASLVEDADKIIASIETTKSKLSPKGKAILKEEEDRKIALEKQALQNASKAAALAARYGGTVGTEAEKIIEETFTPGRGATSALEMQAMSSGGMVKPKYFSVGGPARGTDTIPAMLTPGEFVMSKYAVSNYGVDKMKAINTGTYEGEKVYNYNLSVNVKSDANPDDIARVVMTQIKQIDSQRVRGQRA
jgi:TP901 family phage tail tape measure protein